ncbi:MAG: indole-3-glycerol phosphate synthase TrpC [Erysipelotrichaceae bacterium]|nr:indole-3-glycerol phosphate synthase TrpC [Erysipelotrichaceae bacterium]
MILDKIVDKTLIRVEQSKEKISLDELKSQLPKINYDYLFEQALRKEGMSFIMEVKKASPSKGLIAPDFPYIEIAKDYEKIGASAISILTEPDFFQGSIQYLKEIRQNVSIPLLRKDFTIDEYMIYEAKVYGADAILLICAILDDRQLTNYLKLAHDLGLSAIVETHDEEEMHRALKSGARIIGVNNRNLKDFTVDFHNSIRLRNMVDDDIVFVSESGIKTYEDIHTLEENHVNAVLIGETLMRASDKQAMFDELRGYHES